MTEKKPVFHILSFGRKPQNLMRAIQTETIGSSLGSFESYITEGSTIFLHCNSLLWGIGKIRGSYFNSEERIWSDKIYPHRFHFSIQHLVNQPLILSDGNYNARLRQEFGIGWAYKFIFVPKPLPSQIGRDLSTDLSGRPGISAKKFLNYVENLYELDI